MDFIHVLYVGVSLPYYKDRKCAVNENSSLCIVASIQYNTRDLIVKVVPQTGYRKDIVPKTTTFTDRINRHFCIQIILVFIIAIKDLV